MKPECKRPSTCGSDRAFRHCSACWSLRDRLHASGGNLKARSAASREITSPASTQTPSQATGTVSAAQRAASGQFFAAIRCPTAWPQSASPKIRRYCGRNRSRKGCSNRRPRLRRRVVYVGGLNGYFYALDLATGEEKWKFHSELGFCAPAAVRDGLVYIGDTEGRFVCLDATSGKPNGACRPTPKSTPGRTSTRTPC